MYKEKVGCNAEDDWEEAVDELKEKIAEATDEYKEKKIEVKATLKELDKDDKEGKEEAKKELAEAERNLQDLKQQLKEKKTEKKAAKAAVIKGEKIMDDILDAATSLTESIENEGTEVVREAVRDQINSAVSIFEATVVERLVMLEELMPHVIQSMERV